MKAYYLIVITILAFASCSEQKSESPSDISSDVQFASMSFDLQHVSLVKDLEAAKAGLAAKGEYRCCVMPSCNWCLINDKHCTCAAHLEKGEAVCGSCGQSWAMGRGILPGVEPHDVKWGPGDVHTH